jgi:transposase
VIAEQHIDAMDPTQMREALRVLAAEVAQKNEVIARHEREAAFKQATIDKLTHENAVLKRLKFAAQSERFSAEQRSLLEETLDADLQAVAEQIEWLAPADTTKRERQQPKRQPLPANLPRREVRHELENTTCGCGCQMKRIGEDVAEKLDYEPVCLPWSATSAASGPA